MIVMLRQRDRAKSRVSVTGSGEASRAFSHKYVGNVRFRVEADITNRRHHVR